MSDNTKQSLSYSFILNMWVMKRIDEEFVRLQGTNGRLTPNEVEMILATPQNK